MRSVFVPNSKGDVEKMLSDINYLPEGSRIELSDNEFKTLWKSNALYEFYERTNIFVDDYETTLISDIGDLNILKEVIEVFFKSFLHLNLQENMLQIINKAISQKSGVFFFF